MSWEKTKTLRTFTRKNIKTLIRFPWYNSRNVFLEYKIIYIHCRKLRKYRKYKITLKLFHPGITYVKNSYLFLLVFFLCWFPLKLASRYPCHFVSCYSHLPLYPKHSVASLSIFWNHCFDSLEIQFGFGDSWERKSPLQCLQSTVPERVPFRERWAVLTLKSGKEATGKDRAFSVQKNFLTVEPLGSRIV